MAKTVNLPSVGADRHNPPSTGRISTCSARSAVAGPGRRRLHPGPTAPRTARHGARLGRDRLRQPGRLTAPAAFFSAPRARGVSLLVAPIASWSSSTALLRVYLAVLSGLGLFVALRVWRGLFPMRVLAVAGALFATLWATFFYGPQAMPRTGSRRARPAPDASCAPRPTASTGRRCGAWA